MLVSSWEEELTQKGNDGISRDNYNIRYLDRRLGYTGTYKYIHPDIFISTQIVVNSHALMPFLKIKVLVCIISLNLNKILKLFL